MPWREISANQLNELKTPLIIDVRSPCEHVVENIPGSINVPLLSDIERAEVGTIYARQGEVAARNQALRIISPKIPAIVDQILRLRRRDQALVIHCWRGGLRSEAVASFLSIVGIDCFRLVGGYKAWRRSVLSDFQEDAYSFIPLVLHGLTGVGKTEILQNLRSLGHEILDLEQLANHRGSAFGGLGLGNQPTQKNFEAGLWSQMRTSRGQPVFLEAESRKIGRLSLPDCIYGRIQQGRKILVAGTISARARRIVEEYTGLLPREAWTQAIERLSSLKERLGSRRVQELKEMLISSQLFEAVQVLLLEYYDPLYSRQIERARPFELEVCGDDAKAAADAISAWLNELRTASPVP